MNKKSFFCIFNSKIILIIFLFISQNNSFDTIKNIFNKGISTIKKGYKWARGDKEVKITEPAEKNTKKINNEYETKKIINRINDNIATNSNINKTIETKETYKKKSLENAYNIDLTNISDKKETYLNKESDNNSNINLNNSQIYEEFNPNNNLENLESLDDFLKKELEKDIKKIILKNKKNNLDKSFHDNSIDKNFSKFANILITNKYKENKINKFLQNKSNINKEYIEQNFNNIIKKNIKQIKKNTNKLFYQNNKDKNVNSNNDKKNKNSLKKIKNQPNENKQSDSDTNNKETILIDKKEPNPESTFKEDTAKAIEKLIVHSISPTIMPSNKKNPSVENIRDAQNKLQKKTEKYKNISQKILKHIQELKPNSIKNTKLEIKGT